MKNVNVYEVDDINKLAELIVNQHQHGICTDAILFYEEAANLIKALLQFDTVNISDGCGIHIESPIYDWYEKEFIVSLSDDGTLGCEKAYRDGNEKKQGKYISGFDDFLIVDIDSEYPNELISEYAMPIFIQFTTKCDNCSRCGCVVDYPVSEKKTILKNENNETIGFKHEITADDYHTYIHIESSDEEMLKDYMNALGIECDE